MHREVCEPALCTGLDRLGDESRTEFPVAARPWHVIDTVVCGHDLAHEQSVAPWTTGQAALQDSAMLVTVNPKQMVPQDSPLLRGDHH